MTGTKPEIAALVSYMPLVEEWLDTNFTVHRIWQAKDKDAALAALPKSVTGVAAQGHTKIDGAFLDKYPQFKIISLMSVGYDAIDAEACKARGVALTNTPDVLTDDVADLTLALLVSVSRKIVAGDRYVRDGKWLKGAMPLATAVNGKTLGILGLGRIGKAIAKRGEAFGLKVIYGGRSKSAGVPWTYYPDLVELATKSDYLVVAIPGGPATKHMVNAKVLEALGPKGYLINIARGSVIDEQAMVEMLASGKLGGAGLDVFQDEPRVPEALFALDNVVLQPHVGSATIETRSAMGRLMVDNLIAYFAGKPLLTPV